MFTKIGQFHAKRSNGTVELILIEQEVIDGTALNSSGENRGIKRLRTQGGLSVSKTGPGQYRAIGEFDPVDLTSDDPNRY